MHFENEKIDYTCDKAGNSLKKKYSRGFDEKTIEKLNLNKPQRAIINYIRDSKYKYIKEYIVSRYVIFIIFLILDIIFIICWISYCGCCCCSCCCFKTANPSSKTLRFVFFLIAAICNLLVIIFDIIAISQIGPFVKRINGVVCSSFNFVEHFKDGLGTSYPKESNRWKGVLAIRDLLNDTQIKYDVVIDNSELEQLIQYARANYTDLEQDTCGIKNIIKTGDFENEMNSLDDLISSSYSSIDFQEQIDNIYEAYNKLSDTEDDVLGDTYDFLHDYINKYVKKIYTLFFVTTLIFAFLGLLFLVLYYIMKSNYFRIVYVIIWNISMLLMLLSILIGVSFGLIGTALHDGVKIVQYILSKDNLYNEDPIAIKTDQYVSDLINTCLNEDGEFLNVLQETEEIKINIEKFNNYSNKYNNTIKALSSFNCNDEKTNIAKDSIINVYSSLLDKATTVEYMSSNLTVLNCRFAGNDERIILNEIDSNAKISLVICACFLLVGLLFGISVLSGILFIHRYKYIEEAEPNTLNKTTESTTNIREETQHNNITVDNKDNGNEKI